MSTVIVATVASLLSISGTVFAQGGPPPGAPPSGAPGQGGPPPGDPLGPDLFIAIRNGSVEDVKALLANGAKVEAPNWLGFRPLMWAAATGNKDICAALLDAGADINGPSHYGTPVFQAEMSGNTDLVRYLLERGAKMTKDRGDNIAMLMMAAENDRLGSMRLFLERKVDVNAKDDDGTTALMYAARRGKLAAARLLIEEGADVDAKDSAGRTALMYAAMNGYPGCAELLLKHKASANAQDNTGNTPLMLAARYSGDLKVIRLLLHADADRNMKDKKGRTAVDFAFSRENGDGAAAIRPGAKVPGGKKMPPLSQQARASAERGLRLIEQGTQTFSSRSTCISCHHQGVGLMTTGLAKERGFRYDKKLAAAQMGLILKENAAHGKEIQGVVPHPEMYKHLPGVDMGELTPVMSSVLSGLLAHGERGGDTEAAVAVIMARQQFDDGRWGFLLRREPMQSSQFTTTALTIRLLKSMMPADHRAEAAQRIEKAKAWLIATKATSNEDKAFRLLGLKWAGAEAQEIKKAVADLQGAQRPDGGWAQLPPSGNPETDDVYTRTDAYATGQALYALHLGGGVPATHAAYERGIRYLLRTQDDDGSWLVTKRAVPANTYFDAGFPHGQSQYISYGATCWATMALMLASSPSATPPPAAGQTASVQ